MYGFECASYNGVHPLGSKGSQALAPQDDITTSTKPLIRFGDPNGQSVTSVGVELASAPRGKGQGRQRPTEQGERRWFGNRANANVVEINRRIRAIAVDNQA